MTSPMAFNMDINWHLDKTPVRVDIICLIVAVLLHVPLNFIKVDARKKAKDMSKNRLGEIVMIDQIEEKKDIPVPVPVPQKLTLADRIKAMVKKAPPPPPPKVIEPPKQLADAPKQIALQPKLDMPKAMEAKLQTKEGFKTTAEAKLIEQKISLKTPVAAIAPLSAKKLGTVEDRASLKSDKGNFKIAQNESLQSIGGGPSIADASAPRIAIQTGKSGTKEGFTAPPPQKLDKGKMGNIAGASLDDGKQLGLRDRIIARDAAVGQINTAGSGRALPSGGGAVATKQDAGRFEGGSAGGVLGGVPGGTGVSVGGSSQRISAGTVAPPKKKKEMFQLTGELKDRARTHQEVPQYPAWAEQKGIEAAVVLQFSVEPNGIVKDAIVVVRTSGYPELDELAKKALRRWKFVPLPEEENRIEVGTITFNYTLS